MKFRHAFALLLMSSVYHSTEGVLSKIDKYSSPGSFLASLVVTVMGVGLCALGWRLIVGKDQW